MSSPENVRPAMAPVCQLVRETRVCPTRSEISWLNAPSLEPRRRSLAGCDRRLPAHSRQSASVQTSLRWTGRGPARRTPSRLPPTRSPRPHPTRRGTVPRRPPGQRQTNPRLTRIPADPSSFAGFSLGRLAVRKASPCRAELIWSAVLMPSMRLSPGVQNSGSVPVRAAPRSRPDAKQADFLPRDGDPRARCRDPSPCVLSRTLPTGERLIAGGTPGNPSSNWQLSRFDPHPQSRPLVLRYLRPF